MIILSSLIRGNDEHVLHLLPRDTPLGRELNPSMTRVFTQPTITASISRQNAFLKHSPGITPPHDVGSRPNREQILISRNKTSLRARSFSDKGPGSERSSSLPNRPESPHTGPTTGRLVKKQETMLEFPSGLQTKQQSDPSLRTDRTSAPHSYDGSSYQRHDPLTYPPGFVAQQSRAKYSSSSSPPISPDPKRYVPQVLEANRTRLQ